MERPTTQADSSCSSSSNPFMSLVLSIREYFLVTLTTHPFVSTSVSKINTVLLYVNVPEKSLLTNEEFVLSSTAVVVTLIIYYVLFGKRHRRKRKVLAEELRVAQRQVSFIVIHILVCSCSSFCINDAMSILTSPHNTSHYFPTGPRTRRTTIQRQNRRHHGIHTQP